MINKSNITLAVAIILIILINGCSSIPITESVIIPPFNPPLPPSIILKKVEFKALVETNEVWLALDAKNYENLSKNFEDLASYIESLRVIVYSYQTNNFTQKTNINKIIDKEKENKKSFFKRLFH